MPYPVMTQKNVNNKTRIDISVPSWIEVEGPLGGVSIQYVIEVVAEQNILDTNSAANDVIEFKTSKSFRECEDFYNKIIRKYPKINYPALPKSLSALNTPIEKRKEALDEVMHFISAASEICSCPMLIVFLGIEFTNNAEKSIVLNNESEQSDSVDNESIFKKMTIKPKIIAPEESDKINSNTLVETPVPAEKTFKSSLSEDEPSGEDMFNLSRKRNETGSKPLFDELSLNRRAEKLRLSEPLMFDPQDYGGTLSVDEEPMFFIPGAKVVSESGFNTDDMEDTTELLCLDDDIDQFLAEINQRKSTSDSSPNISSTLVSPKTPAPRPPVPMRPIPPPKPQVLSKPSDLPVTTLRTFAERSPTSSEKPLVPSKPVPLARKLSGNSAPQPKPRTTPPQRQQMQTEEHTSSAGAKLDTIDILKYIENEQKSVDDEPDLFS